MLHDRIFLAYQAAREDLAVLRREGEVGRVQSAELPRLLPIRRRRQTGVARTLARLPPRRVCDDRRRWSVDRRREKAEGHVLLRPKYGRYMLRTSAKITSLKPSLNLAVHCLEFLIGWPNGINPANLACLLP